MASPVAPIIDDQLPAAPPQLVRKQNDAVTPDQLVSKCRMDRHDSLKWWNDAFYGEWAEVYQSMHCRVDPLMVTNSKGEQVEDTTRSNVALPDHFVMVRRGVSRLTRSMPDLKVRGGKTQEQRDKASAMLMYQWDRSEAQKSFRKIVHSSKALGWGIGKSFWDKIEIQRKLRRYTNNLTQGEYRTLQGGDTGDQPDDGAPLPDEQSAAAIAQYGDQVTITAPFKRYEGPTLTSVFVGDILPEPGFKSINDSSQVIEDSWRDEEWLRYWTQQTSEDPETGEVKPVFSIAAAQEALDAAGDKSDSSANKEYNLRRKFRQSVKISDPDTISHTHVGSRRRIFANECHSIVRGHLCVDFFANEHIYLGRLWYPWDTYGKYIYTEMVLIPDLIEGVGDSTPRISRFLMQLRNARFNQTTDFCTNKLLPGFLATEDVDNTNMTRTAWGRIFRVRSMNQIQVMADPTFPSEAWQDQAQLVREMQQTAPETADYSSGTDAMPNAGKLATTAILQAKASDAVLADELSQLNHFVRDTMNIWLAQNQQAMTDSLTIPAGANSRIAALSIRNEDGNAVDITIDPMEVLQESDMEVEPEAGSTLAEDDEFKRNAILQGFQLAVQHPDIFNVRAFGEKLANTIPGMKAGEAMAQPQPPPPPPPNPPRVSFGISSKWMELPPDVRMQILSEAGLPTEDTKVQGALQLPKELNDAATHVAELDRPADPGGTANLGGPDNGSAPIRDVTQGSGG